MAKINTSLEGKVAILTGASSGIGRASALAYAAHGANLVVVSRGKDRLEALAKEARAFGVEVLPVIADVGEEADLQNIYRQAIEKFGGVDILLNNAAISDRVMMQNLQYESFERVLRTNTYAGIRLAQLCHSSLKKRRGVIVNIASDDSLYPSVGLGAYSMSKISQVHFTKLLAVEWGKDGIRVVCVSPSLTRTPMAAEWVKSVEAKLEKGNYRLNPMDRVCEPEEVAAMVLFLSSPAASFINGYNYVVDGGMSAQVPI